MKAHKLNITEARKMFLTLPEKIRPGDSIDIVRHAKTVLRIVRPMDDGTSHPLEILENARKGLPPVKHKPPASLAKNYREYLYGKKS